MEIAARNNLDVKNGPSRNSLLECHLVECEKNAELRFVNKSLRKQVCSQNCASGVIRWICENKLGWDSLCIIQIERICFVEAGKKDNVETVVECKRMWQIYEECGVLDLLDHYAFPDETNAKLEVINKAWNKIMTSNEEVLVLGKTNPKADGGGHLVVCDLKTKTKNGYEICDPQIDKSEFVSRETFTAEIVSVDSIEDLIVFKVNLKKLKQIIDEYRDVLHFPDQNRSTMQEPLTINSVVESDLYSKIMNGNIVSPVILWTVLSNLVLSNLLKERSFVILKTILVILNLLVFAFSLCLLFPTVKKCREPLDVECKFKRHDCQNALIEHIVSNRVFFFLFSLLDCAALCIGIVNMIVAVVVLVVGIVRFIRFKFAVAFAVASTVVSAVLCDAFAVVMIRMVTLPAVAVLIETVIRIKFCAVNVDFLFSERLRILTSILVVFLAVIVVIAVVVPSVHVAKIVFVVVVTVIVVVFIIADFVPSVWPIAVGIAGAVAFVIAVVIIVPVSRICIFLLCHIFSCFYIPYDFDSDLIYTETSAVTKVIVVLVFAVVFAVIVVTLVVATVDIISPDPFSAVINITPDILLFVVFAVFFVFFPPRLHFAPAASSVSFSLQEIYDRLLPMQLC